MQSQVITSNKFIKIKKLFPLEIEFDKLRVLCDYLLFDHFSERLTFPRFQECISILSESQKFDLKKIFMELSGKHKKYITFARLLNAYENLNSKECSKDLKNFFNYFINTVMKVTFKISKKILF